MRPRRSGADGDDEDAYDPSATIERDRLPAKPRAAAKKATAAGRARGEDPGARGQRAAQAACVAQDAGRRRAGADTTCCRRSSVRSRARRCRRRRSQPRRSQPQPTHSAATTLQPPAAVPPVQAPPPRVERLRRIGRRSACRRRRPAIRCRSVPGVPPHLRSRTRCSSSRAAAVPGYPPAARLPAAARPMTPGALYQFQPYGAPPPTADVADRPAAAVRGRRDAVAVQGLGRAEVAQARDRGGARDLGRGGRDVLHHQVDPRERDPDGRLASTSSPCRPGPKSSSTGPA